MTTISVPLTKESEASLNHLVELGYGSNKADAVRRAITRTSEEEALQTVLRAQKEIEDGFGLTGDLRELAKKLK